MEDHWVSIPVSEFEALKSEHKRRMGTDSITVADVVDAPSCLRLVRAWLTEDVGPCLEADPSGFMLGVQSAELITLIDRVLD